MIKFKKGDKVVVTNYYGHNTRKEGLKGTVVNCLGYDGCNNDESIGIGSKDMALYWIISPSGEKYSFWEGELSLQE